MFYLKLILETFCFESGLYCRVIALKKKNAQKTHYQQQHCLSSSFFFFFFLMGDGRRLEFNTRCRIWTIVIINMLITLLPEKEYKVLF